MWFAHLPWQLQFTIIATVVILVIGIVIGASALGKFSIKFGNKDFLGDAQDKKGIKPRTCEDFRKLIMTRTMKFDTDLNKLKNSTLRDQMNYAEQKIQEVSFQLSSTYREDIINNRALGKSVDMTRENKEYILYQETLSNAMFPIKNEIRRSFKENGFVEMSSPEFLDYVKKKTKLLITMGEEYIRSRYPFENMIVSIQDRFNQVPEEMIESAINDLYTKAKFISDLADSKINELGKEFDRDMEEFCI